MKCDSCAGLEPGQIAGDYLAKVRAWRSGEPWPEASATERVAWVSPIINGWTGQTQGWFRGWTFWYDERPF